MNTKLSNPKDAVGISKVPVSTIPMQVLFEIEEYLCRPVFAPVVGELGVGMMEGGRKYGRSNYRAVGVRGSVYFDAAWRHRNLFRYGEDIDPDSGLSHITKAIASLAVLYDGILQGNWTDDRPPKAKLRAKLSPLASWWEGQDRNPVTGHHLILVALAELVVIREEMLLGTWKDDRPQPLRDNTWMKDLNCKAAELLVKYPNSEPAYTELEHPSGV
jgi:hypothetical protein